MVPLGRSRAGFTKKLDFEPNNEGRVGGGGGQVVGGGSRQKDPHWLGIGGRGAASNPLVHFVPLEAARHGSSKHNGREGPVTDGVKF